MRPILANNGFAHLGYSADICDGYASRFIGALLNDRLPRISDNSRLCGAYFISCNNYSLQVAHHREFDGALTLTEQSNQL